MSDETYDPESPDDRSPEELETVPEAPPPPVPVSPPEGSGAVPPPPVGSRSDDEPTTPVGEQAGAATPPPMPAPPPPPGGPAEGTLEEEESDTRGVDVPPLLPATAAAAAAGTPSAAPAGAGGPTMPTGPAGGGPTVPTAPGGGGPTIPTGPGGGGPTVPTGGGGPGQAVARARTGLRWGLRGGRFSAKAVLISGAVVVTAAVAAVGVTLAGSHHGKKLAVIGSPSVSGSSGGLGVSGGPGTSPSVVVTTPSVVTTTSTGATSGPPAGPDAVLTKRFVGNGTSALVTAHSCGGVHNKWVMTYSISGSSVNGSFTLNWTYPPGSNLALPDGSGLIKAPGGSATVTTTHGDMVFAGTVQGTNFHTTIHISVELLGTESAPSLGFHVRGATGGTTTTIFGALKSGGGIRAHLSHSHFVC